MKEFPNECLRINFLYGQQAARVLLLQPSSAAAERVFSLLANSFSEQQTRALEDYVQTSVMLQYNYRSTDDS